MLFKIRFFATIIFALTLYHCQSTDSISKPVPVHLGNVYGNANDVDKKEIQKLFQIMVDAIIENNMKNLLPYIHHEQGIWVDLKASWKKKQFAEDLNNPDGYLEIYFLNTEKLRAKKKSNSILSVRDILLSSGGLYLDYYFEANEECEVDIRFQNTSSEEGNLSNPVFRKISNRWYIYRLL
jgi:hypothetical protein